MISRFCSFLAALFVIGSVHAENLSPIRLYALTCEHLENPIGIGIRQPRLSWKLRSDRIGEVQTAWQIRAASSVAGLKAGSPDLWDSGQSRFRPIRTDFVGRQIAWLALAGFLAGPRLGQERPAHRLERRGLI